MRALLPLTAPVIICAVFVFAAARGVDIYSAMLCGVKKGLKTVGEILPALLVLFPAIYLLRASGVPERLSVLLSPMFDLLGIPSETCLILLLRPISGSGALSAAADIIGRFGADSLIGRTAAVMIGSSETTLYVVAVYFGAAGVKNTRWAIPAALCADLACFISSAWVCKFL